MRPGYAPAHKAIRSRPGFLRTLAWAFTMDGGGQILTLVVSFILAGLLGPRTYGVVAMALVYIAFVQMIQRQGMGSAIIQRKELTGRHLDTAFWLVLVVSAVLTSVSVVFAGWWAGVNDLPELKPIIIALSILIVIEALTTVQQALLTRHMKFRGLAARRLIGVGAGGALGIVGALIGWGAWAIVAQQLTTATVSLVVLWAVSGWRPRLRFSRSAARDLLGFSTGSFLSSVAIFANNRADVLLVGLFFGPLVVGVYQLASRLIDMVVTIASRPIQTVALPELSPYQDDPAEFARRLRRLMRVSAIVALPVLGIVAACADPLIGLLGNEWNDAVVVLQVLSIVGVIRIVIVIDGPLLQALGRPFVQAGITWITAGVSVGTFTVAGLVLANMSEDRQALFIAISRATIYGLLIVAIHVALVRRYTSLTIRDSLSPYLVPLAAGALGIATGTAALALINSTHALLQLTVAGTASAMTALATLLIFQSDLRSSLNGALRKNTDRAPARTLAGVANGSLKTAIDHDLSTKSKSEIK
ncbi:lipopolysaccharide biosynthesis protein [Phytoactinopolyspora endophytica]|uniref:lipopolysaccharide biosynthesis protein n=1 Tax=Phytoactinopolyspora endophytica TaxID=1642495 RepID=UPI0023EA64C2|nr:lipopolysaccharide biosynthesis protein [Phytoactinopolyspora endophytica]